MKLKGNSFQSDTWKDIKVGDFLKILKNEVNKQKNYRKTIPADMIILKTSSENGFSYFQTTNLDG